MSQANAAARKRRAGGASLQEVPTPVQVGTASAGVPKAGLTLPQVISLVDKRLTTLEVFMKETQSQPSSVNRSAVASSSDETESAINSLADEINAKFVMLAGEVENLKDIVLKLQSYTMEVNKTLYEERIQVLSDMGTSSADVFPANKDNIVFDLSEDGDDAQ